MKALLVILMIFNIVLISLLGLSFFPIDTTNTAKAFAKYYANPNGETETVLNEAIEQDSRIVNYFRIIVFSILLINSYFVYLTFKHKKQSSKIDKIT